MKGIRFYVSLFALTAGLAGCSDTGTGPDGSGVTVLVSPAETTLVVGANRQLSAEVRKSDGTVVGGRQIVWSSADTTIASVDQTGVVQARRTGSVVISARSDNGVGTARLTVVAAPAASLRTLKIDQPRVALEEGSSGLVNAIGLDAHGNMVSGLNPVWTSSDESIVWVSSSGGLVGGYAGEAVVTAQVGALSASVVVRVNSVVRSVTVAPGVVDLGVGGAMQLQALAARADGEEVNRPIVWTSEDDGIATVDADGRVTGVAAGFVRIVATVPGGVQGYGTVRVGQVGIYPLRGAEGAPLPAHLYTENTFDDEGIPRTLRTLVSSGTLRTLNNQYRLELTLESWVGDEHAMTLRIADSGTFFENRLTGEISFVSVENPGLDFEGARVAPRSVDIRRQVHGEFPAFTFNFTK